MSKAIQTKNKNIEARTSTIAVVEISDLSFEIDERFPWINVCRIDSTWQKREFIKEINEEDMPLFPYGEEGYKDFKKYCLKWFFRNVEVI